ncbi:multiple epidermal growth factor-like domains protein 11 [Mizuhopecten yessoensis]|uniref:multiple epidermal growth factor-like domains protein 11 n=1 Tax=Mizuhopecten yessoensis TaxID=6573 RepID=UPI000B45F875|nr:multiple epidermal growth factor-like domains protein 11 [Mizuhopecten yessoensis]
MEGVTIVLIGIVLTLGQPGLSLLNLSEGRPTKSSDYREGKGPSSLVVDGNDSDLLNDPNNAAIPQCLYTIKNQKTTFWQVDLEQTVVIDHVEVIFRKGGNDQNTHQTRRNGYSIIVTASSTYLPITQADICYSDTNPALSSANHENQSCSNIGRYVTLYNQRETLSGSDYSNNAVLELCEVKVMGCPKTKHGPNCAEDCPAHCTNNLCYPGNGICMRGCEQGYTGSTCDKLNLSEGRPTKSSDYREGKGPSSLVVDGNDSDLLNDPNNAAIPQCLYTIKNQKTTFWQVDLEQTVVIDHVEVIFRKGGNDQNTHQTRRNGYSIIVTASSTYLPITQADICYSDTNPALSSANHENQSCSNIGRYVTLYNQRETLSGSDYSNNAVLELCEVKVMGCPINKHGPNCAEDCPANCTNNLCFPGNGTCMQGCEPGYTGSTCEKPCDDYYFGQDCASECFCKNATCDNVGGKCPPGGCDPGYNGTSCSTGNYRKRLIELIQTTLHFTDPGYSINV